MTPKQYLAALDAAGIEVGLPGVEIDRQAALLLNVGQRTARRYRLGHTSVPGPVRIALKLVADQRRLAAEALKQAP